MKKILLIEDEKAIREMYARLLRSIGWRVVDVCDAREATNVLIRKELDLVLLDINIPQVDGRKIFDVIKEYDPNLKVMICSVYSIDQQKQMIPDAVDYYDKSQGPFIFLTKVHHALMPDDEVTIDSFDV